MSKSIWVLIFIAALFGGIFWYAGGSAVKDEVPYYLKKITRSTATVVVRDLTIKTEVAKSVRDKERGLSGRDELAVDRGMLFVFDTPDRYKFWMKDTKFPLDIAWIADGKVVHLVLNAPVLKAGEEPTSYEPSVPATQVLEVNAHVLERAGVKVGDSVTVTIDEKISS